MKIIITIFIATLIIYLYNIQELHLAQATEVRGWTYVAGNEWVKAPWKVENVKGDRIATASMVTSTNEPDPNAEGLEIQINCTKGTFRYLPPSQGWQPITARIPQEISSFVCR